MSERRIDNGVWKVISTCFISGLLTLNIFVLTGISSHVNNSFDRVETSIKFVQTSINSSIKELDDKMFTHLTNDEMHTPRGMAVTKSEFNMHRQFANQVKEAIEDSIITLSDDIKELIKKRR